MNNGVRLIEYISKKYPESGAGQTDYSVLNQSFSEYHKFLSNTFIVEEPRRKKDNVEKKLFIGVNTYHEFVDAIISYLVSQKSLNILTKGYLDPSANAAWSSKTINQYVNYSVNYLKSIHWNMLYIQIGRESFINLILNTNCYVCLKKGNFLQIFGTEANFKIKDVKELSKASMLHRESKMQNNLKLLSDDPKSLISGIYAKDFKNIPKKFRNLKLLCVKMIANDKKCNYQSVYINIVGRKEISVSNYNNSTDLHIVIKFVLVIIGKIFPLDIWGSKINKSTIIDKIIEYIQLGAHDTLPVSGLIQFIKIGDIKWTGKTATISSKQDFELRKQLYIGFLEWLFTKFIAKLVKSFWFVIERPQSEVKMLNGGLLYIPQFSWKTLTDGWLERYIEEYLTPSTLERDNTDAISRYNFGHFRLMPKSSDFRLLCIPTKSPYLNSNHLTTKEKEKQKFDYITYMNNCIKPTREVLIQKSKELYEMSAESKHPRCNSISDLVKEIMHFKKGILSDFDGRIPNIFAIKFDMKHCYDRLNQNRIIECVERLFENDDDNKAYFVRQFAEASNGQLKRIKNLVKESSKIQDYNILENENSNIFSRSTCITDRVKTIKLTKTQILRIVNSQVWNSKLITKEDPLTVFKRRQGVFQGFPLSATFCDLVYNSLVDKEFCFLHGSDHRSVLIRIADDFLVLSTNEEDCFRAQEILSGDTLNAYGAFVNNEKTAFVDSRSKNPTIKFVGLTINTRSLEIERDFSSLGSLVLTKYVSFKGVYIYLNWCYTSRLKDYFLNLNLFSIELIVVNIETVVNMILDAFCRDFKRIRKIEGLFDELKFKEFLLRIINATLYKFTIVNDSIQHTDLIFRGIQEAIIVKLKKQEYFYSIINWLLFKI